MIKLTDEHRVLFPLIARKWVDNSHSTARADRQVAEACIKLIYKNKDLPSPTIIWSQSPIGNSVARYNQGDIGSPILDQLVKDEMRACSNAARRQITDSDDMEIWRVVKNKAGSALWHPLNKWVNFTYEGKVWQDVRHSFGNLRSVGVIATLDAYDEIGLSDQVDPVRPILELVQNVGQMLFFKDHCFVSERPTHIEFVDEDPLDLDEEDTALDEKYLHCETRPAICWGEELQIDVFEGKVKLPIPKRRYQLEGTKFILED